MTASEKIELINTLHERVVNYEIDMGHCSEVLVPLDDETIAVLKKLGKSDEWIQANKEVGIDGKVLIDITPVGFEVSSWWTSDNGFQ